MIVGFLSDIHGNAAALDAVLADLPSVDALVCCGDLVGYYPEPAEVVDRIRALGAPSVRGNHERMVCGAAEVPPERARAYRTEWTRKALSAAQLQWLGELPPELDFRWDGLDLRVRHASPWDETTYLYPDSEAITSISLARGQWLVLGHTHHPMLAHCGEGWVANPGSVGQPRDWNPEAAYALLDTGTGAWSQRRVKYDHRAYQERLARLGWEPETIALLGRERARSIRQPVAPGVIRT